MKNNFEKFKKLLKKVLTNPNKSGIISKSPVNGGC